MLDELKKEEQRDPKGRVVHMKNLADNLVVTQANALAHSAFKMTVRESQLLYLAMAHVRLKDDGFVCHHIPITLIKEFLNIEGTSLHTEIRATAKKLLSRIVEIKNEKDDWEAFQWVSYCRYYTREKSTVGEACFEIQLHSNLIPMLLNLHKHFGSVPLSQLVAVSAAGFNSLRVFQILHYSAMYSPKMKKFLKPEVIISVDEFRKWLELEDKYNNFAYLRRDVLERAQKACEEHTLLTFTWEEKKKGRKIVTLKFTVKVNPKFTSEALPFITEADEDEQILLLEPAPVDQPRESNFKSVGEMAKKAVKPQPKKSQKVIFDYNFSDLSDEDKQQALEIVKAVPNEDKQMLIDEVNYNSDPSRPKPVIRRWQYLGKLVSLYNNGKFTPTSELWKLREEKRQKVQAERCPYCNYEGIIYLEHTTSRKTSSKPCNHDEREIMSLVMSREYEITNAKRANNRISKLQQEFSNLREQKAIEIWESWNEEQRQTAKSKFLDPSDTYLCELFNERGLSHVANRGILTSYLARSGYFPEELRSFEAWYEATEQAAELLPA